MADEKWTMIRVRRTTAERLKAAITRLLTKGGVLSHPAWLGGQELTLDRMIQRLLDHQDNDRARSKKWSETRSRRQLGRDLAYLNDRYEINPAFESAELMNVRQDNGPIQDR